MRLFGLIGFPLSHSFSEKYFAEKFLRENIGDAAYRNFPLEKIDQLHGLISANPDLSGLNVTIPWKEKVIPYLDEIDETAKAIGAVNTILLNPFVILSDSRRMTKGFNTDVYGFRQSIKPFLTSAHERALILGTGGASKAVEYVLKQIGVDCIFVSREKKNILGKTILTYEELNSYVVASCKLIVNCSPVGTFPNVNEFPKLPYESITKEHLLYDLIYNPAETEFLKKGKAQGAEIMNGLDMLKLQAEKAWEIWNSKI
ncbi:MAG: shikimate dehydrogenase [Bacteroidota bacterium]|nr:shikimate dehydrogenase [Bacteroidota bacterium]